MDNTAGLEGAGRSDWHKTDAAGGRKEACGRCEGGRELARGADGVSGGRDEGVRGGGGGAWERGRCARAREEEDAGGCASACACAGSLFLAGNGAGERLADAGKSQDSRTNRRRARACRETCARCGRRRPLARTCRWRREMHAWVLAGAGGRRWHVEHPPPSSLKACLMPASSAGGGGARRREDAGPGQAISAPSAAGEW